MVADVKHTVFTEMAPDSRFFGTRFGVIAWPAGAQKARPTPNKAAAAKQTSGFVPPSSVNSSSAAAAANSTA